MMPMDIRGERGKLEEVHINLEMALHNPVSYRNPGHQRIQIRTCVQGTRLDIMFLENIVVQGEAGMIEVASGILKVVLTRDPSIVQIIQQILVLHLREGEDDMMIKIAGGENATDGSPKTNLGPHLSQALHLRSQLMETLVHSKGGDIVHLDQRWRCLGEKGRPSGTLSCIILSVWLASTIGKTERSWTGCLTSYETKLWTMPQS
jgi:hypothetical protein